MNLAQSVINHERNSLITFKEKEHQYFFADSEGTTLEFFGITSLIGEYQEPFDAQEVSKWVARRDGKPQQEVLDEWKKKAQRAIDLGNHTHHTIEDYVKDGTITDQEIIDIHDQAIAELGIEPITCEWVVYDESINRASAIDGVYKWEDKDEIVIVDYKTNEDWTTKYWKTYENFNFPIHHLPDNKYHKYSLQLNFYRMWVEEIYKLPVSEQMFVLHIRDGEYTWIPILNYRDEVELIYETEKDLLGVDV